MKSNLKFRKIEKILIANRGEIAIRIHKTAKEMGIKTITLYTEEEKDLPHALLGDESVNLGSGPLKETYLNQEKILRIARELKACAIHPGYGFLSEKADFAKKVNSEGLIFIGPSVEAIELMGDKKTSKEKIVELNVPSIPGYHGNNQSPEFLKKEAIKMGFPVLIKASAGGGGKGMRIVTAESDFLSELEGAKREALNAFSDDTVLIEKYIQSPRHIEIQVMSDSHGNHFHLYERECSIQRRYQKIVEESPSTALDANLRLKMTEAALKITRGINYLGAGTVELILDTDGSFYFLEMNTRLQVEHPVTEMVTGLDLVKLQILVAQGEKLNFSQEDIKQKGHAIEVRLYAEDPDNHFLPSIGRIDLIGDLTTENCRLDCGYKDGNHVSTAFDPMLAKLISYGKNRDEAIEKMQLALNEIVFLGNELKTNRDYLKRILSIEPFFKGLTYTHFVKTYADLLKFKEASEDEISLGIAQFLLLEEAEKLNKHVVYGPWKELIDFKNIR